MMDAAATSDLGLSPSGEFNETENGLTPEEKKKQEEELLQELQEVEKEIATLKTVLSSKVRRSNEIKRKMGITVWSEMRDTAKTGFTELKGSSAYKNTVQVAQTAKEKTSGVFSSAKEKLTTVTTSNPFKSFGEKVGSAYSSVKQSKSFMDFRSHSDKLKVVGPGESDGAAQAEPLSEPTTLEAAISADKQNKLPSSGSATAGLGTSVTLTAADASSKK